jgi:hypothetical protein
VFRPFRIRTASRRLLPAIVCAAVAGCAVTPRDHVDFYSRVPIENRPVVQPVRAISSFSDGLACMDRMLRDLQGGTTLVTSKIIPDASGKIFVATKEMVVTALSQMSRTSNAFRYVDYEVDALKQDTVQNLTTLLLNAGQMRVQKPVLYISGALSYMDQNVLLNRKSFGVSSPDVDLGYSSDVIGTAFGLELHLGDFNTRTLLPGVDSANEIVVANAARAVDLGGRIKKTGVQFALGQEVSQGVGPAVRTLVELGLIELAGKWARVPYWQCLALDQAHPEFQRQLADWWAQMTGEERIRLAQTGLKSSGYYAGAVDGRPSPALREALLRFQADQGGVPSGNLNFETYERLIKDYVAFDGTGYFIRIGWGPRDKAIAPAKGGPAAPGILGGGVPPDAASYAPRNGRPALDATGGKPVRVTIGLNNPDAEFAVGESLVLTVSTDRMAHLYCWYQDAKRKVAQIYPNPLQRVQPLQGNHYVRIPDPDNPNSFTIEFDRPGQEAVLCVAAESDLRERLPRALRGPPLVPIAGIAAVDEIAQAVQRAAPGAVGTRKVAWTVRRQ